MIDFRLSFFVELRSSRQDIAIFILYAMLLWAQLYNVITLLKYLGY